MFIRGVSGGGWGCQYLAGCRFDSESAPGDHHGTEPPAAVDDGDAHMAPWQSKPDYRAWCRDQARRVSWGSGPLLCSLFKKEHKSGPLLPEP
jgi:hypothetical protein